MSDREYRETVKQAAALLDLLYKFHPTDPAKAATLAKEFLIADHLNQKYNTNYRPSLNVSEEGVDLFDALGNDPPTQSKVTGLDRYECGKNNTLDEVARRALKRDENAMVSFAKMNGSKILEHFLGHASLLLRLKSRSGNYATGVSFNQLRKLGFVDIN